MSQPLHARFAAICPNEKCLPTFRVFFDSRAEAEAWRCPEHNRGRVQENAPYRGKPVA